MNYSPSQKTSGAGLLQGEPGVRQIGNLPHNDLTAGTANNASRSTGRISPFGETRPGYFRSAMAAPPRGSAGSCRRGLDRADGDDRVVGFPGRGLGPFDRGGAGGGRKASGSKWTSIRPIGRSWSNCPASARRLPSGLSILARKAALSAATKISGGFAASVRKLWKKSALIRARCLKGTPLPASDVPSFPGRAWGRKKEAFFRGAKGDPCLRAVLD